MVFFTLLGVYFSFAEAIERVAPAPRFPFYKQSKAQPLRCTVFLGVIESVNHRIRGKGGRKGRGLMMVWEYVSTCVSMLFVCLCVCAFVFRSATDFTCAKTRGNTQRGEVSTPLSQYAHKNKFALRHSFANTFSSSNKGGVYLVKRNRERVRARQGMRGGGGRGEGVGAEDERVTAEEGGLRGVERERESEMRTIVFDAHDRLTIQRPCHLTRKALPFHSSHPPPFSLFLPPLWHLPRFSCDVFFCFRPLFF